MSLVLDKKINTLESATKQHINVLEFHHVVWLIGSGESKSSPDDNKSNPFWLVPFDRNLSFVGRDSIVENIDQAFTGKEGSQPKASLCGLGGIGKSQIALEYCCRARGKLSVFWIHAATATRPQEFFTLIANHCGLTERSDKVMIVHDWLQYQYKNPWIMVMDNVDDPKSLFQDHVSSDKTLWGCIARKPRGRLLFNNKITRHCKAGDQFESESLHQNPKTGQNTNGRRAPTG